MVTIRKARAGDLDSVVGLWQEFMGYHQEIIRERPGSKEQFELRKDATENFRRFTKEKIASRDSEVFLAEDRIAVGYCLIYVKDTVPIYRVNSVGYISDIFVKPSHRGQGLSSRFKEMAFEWFRGKGLKYSSILVYSGNHKAHGIYRKWGFQDFHVELRKRL